MKKLLFSLIAIVILTVFGYGKSFSYQIDPSNLKNNYDFVGQLHNKGLESFVNNYTKINGLESNKKMSFATLINSNSSYLGQDSSINNFNTLLIKNNSLYSYLKNIDLKNSSFVTALDAVNFKTSIGFKEYYLQMINGVDQINNNDEASFSKYIELIKKIESSVQISSLQSIEKDMLLATASVARYSGSYWFYNKAINNWNPNNVTLTSNKHIIKCDIAGAAGGAAAGAIIGGTVTIPAGGIGAVPGWVAGAITGAVGGSVTQAVYEFLDWLF